VWVAVGGPWHVAHFSGVSGEDEVPLHEATGM